MSTTDALAFWDGVYAARPAADAPRPNARLTETVSDLPPGQALDLGCGEGGDEVGDAAGWVRRHQGPNLSARVHHLKEQARLGGGC
jgi:hypothetical protein